MKRETIVVTISEEPVTVVLRSSTVGDGSYHTTLLIQADQIAYDGTAKSFDRKNVGTYLYPHLVACVESPVSVREMSLDDFILLEELEVNNWVAASNRINGHWWQAQSDYVQSMLAKYAELTAEQEKKIGIPSNGSQQSTTIPMPQMTDSQPSSN
jgi:hypothetical protein